MNAPDTCKGCTYKGMAKHGLNLDIGDPEPFCYYHELHFEWIHNKFCYGWHGKTCSHYCEGNI